MTASSVIPLRDEAWALLCEWTDSPGLRGHGLAVEAAMRGYARYFGEDEDIWGVIGLLHDFDYERYPDAQDHPQKGAEELRARGYAEWFIQTIVSHADYSGIDRDTSVMKSLYAVDELCGLVIATVLVQPNRKLDEVTTKSVTKKMKRKEFARSVSRDDIRQGTESLGIDLDEHITRVIESLRTVATELGF
jgi:putative nucleotidyltransferase with HDIG domain